MNANPQSSLLRYQCPHCNAVLETDEPIEGIQVPCPECGGEFVATAMDAMGEASNPPFALLFSPRSHGKSGKRRIGILLLACILLALAAGALFMIVAGSGHVESTLGFRTEREHSKTFGGRVPPEAYSFNSPGQSAPPKIQPGNPVYFLRAINPTWEHRETSPGEKHIFMRRDEYFEDNSEREAEWKDFTFFLGSSITIGHKFQPESMAGYNAGMADGYARAIQKNALTRGIHFPSPVVMSDNAYDTRFCYLNESGKPSVLEWGAGDEDWFWCHEGQKALSQYAKCLRELRDKLVECTEKAKNSSVASEVVRVKNLPTIYLGRLDAGTREKTSVEYEFVKDWKGCGIKETTTAPSFRGWHTMTLESLDAKVEFYSRFETAKSTEKAFEPLYCFLTQRKIERTGNGNKKQMLTFAPIREQCATASVELEATAESGGSVVFEVWSGPGKIEGNILTFTGVGATGVVGIRARQWGDRHWAMASSTQCVHVVKASQEVHFAPIEPRRVGDSVKLAATADSGAKATFSVLSGPGKIEDGVLTFSAAGQVKVRARVKGNDIWEEASATQIVEVQSGNEHTTPAGPAILDMGKGSQPSAAADEMVNRVLAMEPKRNQDVPQSGTGVSEMANRGSATKPDRNREDPVLAPLAVALEAARDNPTGANFKKLEEVWKALPEEQKTATQKPVMWAFCAMLWSKGQTGAVAKRQSLIDYRAFLEAVTDRCHDCGGGGRSQETCRTCGGTGIRRSRCGTCGGSGSCAFCHGSGQTGGRLGGSPLRCPQCGGSGRCKSCGGNGTREAVCGDCGGGSRSAACRTCNGTGRIVEEYKCDWVVEENIQEALRICREMKVAEVGLQASPERPGRGQSAALPAQARGEASSPVQAALEAARKHPNLKTFEQLETLLDTLSDEDKVTLQKPVMTAFCAMLLAEDNSSELSKRMKYVDYRALIQSVRIPCDTCGGDGRLDKSCTECGGTGKCKYCHGTGMTEGVLTGRKVRCPTCNAKGHCPACSGGTVQVPCKTCSGSGRILSKGKCQEVVNQNLDEALRICREML